MRMRSRERLNSLVAACHDEQHIKGECKPAKRRLRTANRKNDQRRNGIRSSKTHWHSLSRIDTLSPRSSPTQCCQIKAAASSDPSRQKVRHQLMHLAMIGSSVWARIPAHHKGQSSRDGIVFMRMITRRTPPGRRRAPADGTRRHPPRHVNPWRESKALQCPLAFGTARQTGHCRERKWGPSIEAQGPDVGRGCMTGRFAGRRSPVRGTPTTFDRAPQPVVPVTSPPGNS
jgi:hypothetical protein